MKSLFILSIALIAFNSFASNDCGFEAKKFKAIYSKGGESQIVQLAYKRATQKAESEGFKCSDHYRYSVTPSITVENRFIAFVAVDCLKENAGCGQDSL
jgi:hypothetical protein